MKYWELTRDLTLFITQWLHEALMKLEGFCFEIKGSNALLNR